jgi:type IV secretory pathway TrbF-like protein
MDNEETPGLAVTPALPEPVAETPADLWYREIARRDGNAESREWRAWQLVMLLGVLTVLGWGTSMLLWMRADVRPFVQVVQVDSGGKIIQLGTPIALLQFTPQEGQWLDMLRAWVEHVRWLGTDSRHTKYRWAQAALHTCGEAIKKLEMEQVRQKPFEQPKKQVLIEFQSFLKLPLPHSYQVIWIEHITEGAQRPREETWSGTFTVGRRTPKTEAEARQNPLGLCVTAFQMSGKLS